MTRAETELLLQLTKDTNARLTKLVDKFEEHAQEDVKRFSKLDGQWTMIKWGFWPLAGIILALLGFEARR